MRLLLAALRPAVERLQLWVEEGSLSDHFDEMPICKGDHSSVSHASVMYACCSQNVLGLAHEQTEVSLRETGSCTR